MIDYKVQDSLLNEWQAVLERYVDLSISTILGRVRNLSILLYHADETCLGKNLICCEIKFTDYHGDKISVSVKNSDGEIAIRESIARMRRTIIRRSQFSTFREKVA